MMKAKEWLLSKGHIDAITRGRMSLENHARLKAAYDAGERFSDWPKGEVKETASPTGETEVRVVRDPNQTNEKVVSELFYRYGNGSSDDLNRWHAVTEDGTIYGMKEACSCGYSLIGHVCDTPTVLGKPVTIKEGPPKVPYSAKLW